MWESCVNKSSLLQDRCKLSLACLYTLFILSWFEENMSIGTWITTIYLGKEHVRDQRAKRAKREKLYNYIEHTNCLAAEWFTVVDANWKRNNCSMQRISHAALLKRNDKRVHTARMQRSEKMRNERESDLITARHVRSDWPYSLDDFIIRISVP